MMRMFVFTIVFSWITSALAQEKVKVGVSLPLTGEAALYGAELKNVLEFANTRIANGHLRLVYEDDKCSGKEGTVVAQKFTSLDRVSYAVVGCSAAILASATIYERATTPVIVPLGSAAEIANLGGYVYRTSTNDRIGAEVLAREIKAQHRRVVILVNENDYSVSFYRNLREVLPSDIESKVEFYKADTLDLRSTILRMKNFKPDGYVIMPLSVTAAISLIKQIRGLGNQQKIYSLYMVYPEASLKGLQGDGVYNLLNTSSLSSFTQDGKKLYQEYVALHGTPTYDLIFTAGVETIRALYQTAQQREKINAREYLNITRFDGIIGPWQFNTRREVDFWRFEVTPVS